ncbi:probable cytochrome P450 301a1, mitochondrial isoform X2 [Trichoplusia ni]|uniref:Probable cytochrome P450 301a1, mitochondrial isoform X2 n=1 Tax=Trichoplusia ni TaxID=7111 RepID=A0A7E5VRK1_TRINI|nr:probable cytochrome P450 301a1, mitochondrial isoform X2 [Trichoplusia ni]
MFLNQVRNIQPYMRLALASPPKRWYEKTVLQTSKPQENDLNIQQKARPTSLRMDDKDPVIREIYSAARVMPMMLTNKEPIVLPFDDVPGPRVLKYISSFRQYLSEMGTQLTVGALTVALNIGTYLNTKKPLKNLSTLFDEYGPVVRFVSPVGGDIVLINHPEHIQKVYTMEGDCPVRSTLDSLEKYRSEHRNVIHGGLYTAHGEEWNRQRAVVLGPLHSSVTHHLMGINDVCEHFTQKIYNLRTYQDDLATDLYKELHKWAFDCMGLVLFSKKFTMLDTELVYSQCDMSWLYHSLDKATDAIVKCESGLHLWKLFPTPAWTSLVKYCDSLDNLIGKHVLEAEQSMSFTSKEVSDKNSLINAMLMSEEKMSPEDISTIIMDMLLIGVNTITSSMSFLLYYLAKYQRAQKLLYKEINNVTTNLSVNDMAKIAEITPYLQACIKETLRLVPPIPVLTRILPRNITLDRYNIPRGTLIIMSTQDASIKEGNYEDASVFYPERWLKDDAMEYHPFASIPFGFGARKCLGQNIAETMLSLMTIRILQRYKLEYLYGDVQSTRSFISKPNKPLKVRFIDRV